MTHTPTAPDGGFWGWMAVIGCFMGNVIGDGVMYSFGVFIPKLKEYFGAGSAEVSTIYSIQVGVTFGSGPIASYMTNKLGWIWSTVIGTVITSAGLVMSAFAPSIVFLYFSAGAVLGLGLGIIYLPRLDCITQYFDKKRPFVTGIAICGSGLGTFIFAPITERLIRELGWQYAMLTIGGICMFNCIFAFFFKPLTYESEKDVEAKEKLNSSDMEKSEAKETVTVMMKLLCDVVFMMFAVSNFFTSLGYPIPYTFIPDNAKALGMTDEEGSFAISIIGISNTIARLVLGLISQKINRLFLYNTCLVFCGLSMSFSNYFQPFFALASGLDCSEFVIQNATEVANFTLVANSTDIVPPPIPWECSAYIGQVIYALCFGVTSAAYVLLTTLVLADLLGPAMFTNSFGLLLLFQGVATIIGPPIVGYMFDVYGNYDYGFVLMGLFITFSGLILYPVPCVQRIIQSRLQPIHEDS